jgi:hypothetical protein
MRTAIPDRYLDPQKRAALVTGSRSTRNLDLRHLMETSPNIPGAFGLRNEQKNGDEKDEKKT